jgi:hypothetical protein
MEYWQLVNEDGELKTENLRDYPRDKDIVRQVCDYNPDREDAIQKLIEALESAEEKFHLIWIQNENHPEDAAINCDEHSSEGLKEMKEALTNWKKVNND